MKGMKMKQCTFDIKGVCHALGCYSSQKCGARDKKGNPKYCSNDMLRKELGSQHIELMFGIAQARLDKANNVQQ